MKNYSTCEPSNVAVYTKIYWTAQMYWNCYIRTYWHIAFVIFSAISRKNRRLLPTLATYVNAPAVHSKKYWNFYIRLSPM